MTAPSTQVTSLLTQFGLTTAAEELVPRLTEAGHPEAMPVLVEVFEAEAEARRQRRITRLRRASRLPPGKTFATLDTGRFPAKVAQQLETLASGARYGEEPLGSGHRPRRDPAGLPRHLPRGPDLPRGTRRGDARRDPQGLPGRADPGAPAHHRQPRHAQAAPHRGRGPARTHHAPLRAGLHDAHLEPAGRGLGQAARRHRRRHGAAGSPPPSRARAEVRAAELAHQGPDDLREHRGP